MDCLTAAPPGFHVITSSAADEPIVAFDHVSQMPVPITVKGKITGPYAILYPDHRVWSRQSGRVFDHQQDFFEHEGFGTVNVPGADIPIRSLRISNRACAPLERMDIHTLGDLARRQRSEIAGVRGVSDESLANMDKALETNGLRWGWTDDDDEKDESEDVL